MANFTKAKPSNLSRKAIEEIAESLSIAHNCTRHSALNEMLEPFGGELQLRDYLQSGKTGSIEIRSKNDFDVYIPLHTSPEQDRFTVAHELGHYVLHYLWPAHKGERTGMVYADRYGHDRAEAEANWFASAYLMPRQKVKKLWEENTRSAGAFAAHFAVSTAAASHRLKRLNLLNELNPANAEATENDAKGKSEVR